MRAQVTRLGIGSVKPKTFIAQLIAERVGPVPSADEQKSMRPRVSDTLYSIRKVNKTVRNYTPRAKKG